MRLFLRHSVTPLLFSFFSLFSTSLMAEISVAEAERLGADLTPLGGEKAANAAGTIPAWNGGLTQPPENYKKGDHHPDPFEEEQPLFVINSDNMSEYEASLTEGHKALLHAYKGYSMKVYPSHRTAAAPERIYAATKKVATTARLSKDGNGVAGSVIGIPFPLPKNGLEVVWNHILRWRGDVAERFIGQAAPTRGGDYSLVKFRDEFFMRYSHADMSKEALDNTLLYLKQKVLSPARLAGGILLVHETLNQSQEHRKAWVYNKGQRRVRRAPSVAFDNPGTASDGMRTNDQFDMFNGSPERYNWQLLGKKELLVPYNNYQLHSDKLKYSDILTPQHINPEYLRYELHRVWVVKATLKEGQRHIYKSRTFYVDEDSWQILVVDQYDNRDQIWRVSEGFVINYYEVPTLWTTLEVHTDLQAGRYIAIGLDNEDPMYNFDLQRSEADYSISALRREGRR
ncbi:MAG: DUF1329 domain-containing protein [Gammaproteobacteria bacterium]|nr:DUF1329 domain-containing protein [Gammaproteobacteria bacterium]